MPRISAQLQAHGTQVSFVDATDATAVERALRPETRIVFVETIANPRTQVADLERIGALCRSRSVVYVVDNTMTSPYLFLPKSVGASMVVNSLTKYIGGHGNALGGAITLWAYVDANNTVPENNEVNNTATANVANQPPTVALPFQCNLPACLRPHRRLPID